MSLNGVLDCIRFDESLAIHPSRLASFLPESFCNFQTLNNKILVYKIHFFIQKKCGQQTLNEKLLKDPYCKLLTIPIESWLLMEKFLGALYCTDEIKRVIDGTTRISLQNFLSQSIYECIYIAVLRILLIIIFRLHFPRQVAATFLLKIVFYSILFFWISSFSLFGALVVVQKLFKWK